MGGLCSTILRSFAASSTSLPFPCSRHHPHSTATSVFGVFFRGDCQHPQVSGALAPVLLLDAFSQGLPPLLNGLNLGQFPGSLTGTQGCHWHLWHYNLQARVLHTSDTVPHAVTPSEVRTRTPHRLGLAFCTCVCNGLAWRSSLGLALVALLPGPCVDWRFLPRHSFAGLDLFLAGLGIPLAGLGVSLAGGWRGLAFPQVGVGFPPGWEWDFLRWVWPCKYCWAWPLPAWAGLRCFGGFWLFLTFLL